MARSHVGSRNKGGSKGYVGKVKRAGESIQQIGHLRIRRRNERIIMHNIVKAPDSVIAGIYSKKLDLLIQAEANRLRYISIRQLNTFLDRIELAKLVCTRTRATEEAAFGKAYYNQQLSCRRLMALAEKIIFSQDESIRDYYRQRLKTTWLLPSYSFTPHRVP